MRALFKSEPCLRTCGWCWSITCILDQYVPAIRHSSALSRSPSEASYQRFQRARSARMARTSIVAWAQSEPEPWAQWCGKSDWLAGTTDLSIISRPLCPSFRPYCALEPFPILLIGGLCDFDTQRMWGQSARQI